MVQKIIQELEEMYEKENSGMLRKEEAEAFAMNNIIGQAANVIDASAFAQEVARWYISQDFDSMSDEEYEKYQIIAGLLCMLVGAALVVNSIDEVYQPA